MYNKICRKFFTTPMKDMLFSDLGFSINEQKVYETLLQTGGAFVSNLSRITGIERVSLYYTLENLHKRGIVTMTKRKNIRFYVPEKPERLVNMYQQKLNSAEQLVEDLRLIEQTSAYRPSFAHGDTLNDAADVLEEIFSHDHIVSYANIADWMRCDKSLLETHLTSLAGPSALQLIFPYTQEVQAYIRTINTSIHPAPIQFVSIDVQEFPFSYDVFIADDIVGIFSFKQDDIVAIRMQSQAYAESQRAIFSLAWLGATAFVV